MKPRRSGEQHIIKSWFIRSSQGSAKFNVAVNWQVTLKKKWTLAISTLTRCRSFYFLFVFFWKAFWANIYSHMHTHRQTHIQVHARRTGTPTCKFESLDRINSFVKQMLCRGWLTVLKRYLWKERKTTYIRYTTTSHRAAECIKFEITKNVGPLLIMK